ncbi:hypothetical protein DFP73DRAFT_485987 [Morchella snyderi]|nr:hypothetical protein DFP73DRAFT_485987 [Morchella snyderi]
MSENNGCSKPKRNIKIILDLNEPPIEHWKGLFPKVRTIIHHLRKDGITAKVLIMDPPMIGNLELVPGSEVHVMYDKERQDCLSKLHFNNSRSKKVSAGYAHTFEWLWKTPEYLCWNSTQECGTGLLLIEGKPGSGKSTMVRFFKDNFSPISSNKIILASFFYHARNGDSERNHANMLKTLLYQILEADESFFACIQPLYRHALRRNEFWGLEALKEALRACKRHILSRSLFLIVDAMDESENTDRTEIIQFFRKLTERVDDTSDGKCLVKVCLTSRPINELHASSLGGYYRILLQERNKKDIESYTDAFLQNSVFDSVGGAKPALKEYIMEHADGMFLWVHLVAKELVKYAMKGSRQGKLLKFLKSPPKGLEDFYQHMLEGLDSDDPDDLVDGRRILQFCLFSHRAMELQELEHALAIPGLPNDPEPESASWELEKPTSIRRLLTQCIGGFVDIQRREKPYAVIQAMHHTVREFFLRPYHRVQYSHLNLTSDDDARAMIQLTCVRFIEVLDWELALTSARDVEHIGSRQALIEHLNKRPFFKYAIGYLKESTEIDPAIMERLRLVPTRNIVGPHMHSMYLLIKPLLIAFDAADTCHKNWSRVQHQSWNLTYQAKLDSLLQRAAGCGLPIAVGNLIAASASVDGDEVSPLNLASKGGHYLTAAVLLDHGASPEQQDQCGNKALHLAV